MAYFLFRRTAGFILTLLAVSVVVFAVMNVLPGDPALTILGLDATEDALAALREQLGLNEPVVSRYFSWLGNALQGDLGTALTNGQDISKSVGARLKNTLFLAGWAAIVSVPLAIFLGLLAVRYRDRWPDKLISAVTLTSISIPESSDRAGRPVACAAAWALILAFPTKVVSVSSGSGSP